MLNHAQIEILSALLEQNSEPQDTRHETLNAIEVDAIRSLLTVAGEGKAGPLLPAGSSSPSPLARPFNGTSQAADLAGTVYPASPLIRRLPDSPSHQREGGGSPLPSPSLALHCVEIFAAIKAVCDEYEEFCISGIIPERDECTALVRALGLINALED